MKGRSRRTLTKEKTVNELELQGIPRDDSRDEYTKTEENTKINTECTLLKIWN